MTPSAWLASASAPPAARSATSTRISPRLRASGIVERYWSNATRHAVGGDRGVVRPVGDRHDRRARGARPRRPVVAALAEPARQLGELAAQQARALRACHRAIAHGAARRCAAALRPRRRRMDTALRPFIAPDVERAVLLDAQVAEALGRDSEDRRRVALDRPLVQRVEVDVLREVALDDDPVGARPQLLEPRSGDLALARRHEPVGEPAGGHAATVRELARSCTASSRRCRQTPPRSVPSSRYRRVSSYGSRARRPSRSFGIQCGSAPSGARESCAIASSGTTANAAPRANSRRTRRGLSTARR